MKLGSPFPIFGRNNIITTLEHIDGKLNHQGINLILKALEKEKIIFFDKADDATDFTAVTLTREYLSQIHECGQCDIVEDLKTKGDKVDEGNKSFYKLTNEDDILDALNYADAFHTGKYS